MEPKHNIFGTNLKGLIVAQMNQKYRRFVLTYVQDFIINLRAVRVRRNNLWNSLISGQKKIEYFVLENMLTVGP